MRGSNGVLQSPLGMRNLRCEGHLSPENSPTEAFGVHLLHTWKQWSMMSVERLDMIERINHTWISADLAQDSTWQTNPRLVLQIETGPDLGRALHGAVLLETYLCEPLRNITRNAVLKICFCSSLRHWAISNCSKESPRTGFLRSEPLFTQTDVFIYYDAILASSKPWPSDLRLVWYISCQRCAAHSCCRQGEMTEFGERIAYSLT